MADGGLTFAQFAESMRHVEEHAYDLPVVHWRGLDSQEEMVTFPCFAFRRPTRCGLFDVAALLGYPLEHVTCPQCLELAAADANGGDHD